MLGILHPPLLCLPLSLRDLSHSHSLKYHLSRTPPAPDFCPSARSTPPVFPRVCGHPSGDSSQTPLSRLAPKCRLHAGSLLPRWALMRAPFQPHCHCLGSHPDRLCPQLSYGSAYLASTPTLQVQLRRLRATGIRSILPCCCRERGPGGPGTDQCLCPKQDT